MLNLECSAHLFADDFVIYWFIQNHEDCTNLQNDLHLIEMWCSDWLPIIYRKNKAVSFSTLKNLVQHSYKFSAQPIEKVSSYKYLGVHLTQSFLEDLHRAGMFQR